MRRSSRAWRRRAEAAALAVGLLGAVAWVAVAGAQDQPPAAPPPATPVDCGVPKATASVFGRSVEGRPLPLVRIARVACPPTRTVLIVGAIHGEEPMGRRIVDRLLARRGELPQSTQLLLVRSLNPDGIAHGTRGNRHGVDLNRNSREGWVPLGFPGAPEYGGPKPFSEPESLAMRALLLRERPDIVIWYHQPFGLVDMPESGWNGRARRYAKLVGLPNIRLTAFNGSMSRWTNARVRPGSSFVVELPAGPLSAASAERHASAVLTLAGA